VKVENVRIVDMKSIGGLGWKIHTQLYLGRDNLGDLIVNVIIVLKMGVRPKYLWECTLDLASYGLSAV
jgi:hypothetical protein